MGAFRSYYIFLPQALTGRLAVLYLFLASPVQAGNQAPAFPRPAEPPAGQSTSFEGGYRFGTLGAQAGLGAVGALLGAGGGLLLKNGLEVSRQKAGSGPLFTLIPSGLFAAAGVFTGGLLSDDYYTSRAVTVTASGVLAAVLAYGMEYAWVPQKYHGGIDVLDQPDAALLVYGTLIVIPVIVYYLYPARLGKRTGMSSGGMDFFYQMRSEKSTLANNYLQSESREEAGVYWAF